ncbi:MAG TPA: dienelactone hydrolase family protein [Urbifossiella sp.]|jgi:dienelactone hydrolase|nr:dienelactone hydrolase family protein [Urbifossiella sp.]
MTRRTAPGVSAPLLMFVLGLPAPAPAAEPAPGPVTRGTFRFDPAGDDKADVPDRYRMPARDFDFALTPRFEMPHAGVSVLNLTFPSPVKSDVPANDTVHAEYFVPKAASAAAKVPGVVVLDIMDGAGTVARGQAVWLAQHGTAALYVHMAHYGPRRPPGSPVRMMSTNLEQTFAAVRQTVLDCRAAAAWLGSRPEVNADKLGLIGTSLGSLIGANVAAAEPRLKNVCLLLPAGGLVDAFYDHPKARPYTAVADLLGGREGLKRLIAPADPITYAPQLRQRNLLMIAASRDDVLPPSAARALWEASGKQRIMWVDSTHVGAAAYALPALKAVSEHVAR